jgi:predicted metal-dependent peptidase
MNDVQGQLAKASKNLLLSEPFYGLFLITLNKDWKVEVGTAGVSKNGINTQLTINPVFWDNLSEDCRVGVLKHELLHIAFQHLILRDKYPDKKLFNIAADLEINQYIDQTKLPGHEYSSREEYLETVGKLKDAITSDLESGKITQEEASEKMMRLPIRVIFFDDFADLNLDRKKGTDYYYKKLLETMKPDGSSSCKALDGLLNGNGDPSNHHKHATWNEFDGLGEAEKKMIQKQIDYQVKNAAEQTQKSRGTIPGCLKDYIDSLFYEEEPKFDWRGYFRRFTGGSIKIFTKKSRRKLSKRFFGNPGLKIKPKKRILVGVDTSGSVSKNELEEFFTEIHHMYKTGAEIVVVQCDTAISNVQEYTKSKDGKIKIHGRGGTSFQPVIDYFNEHRRDFSCMVYLTDGEAPAPNPKAKGRCLWVLSSSSSETDHLPGHTIKLN